MEEQLSQLLQDLASSSSELTHESYYDTRKDWAIPHEHVGEFWQAYCDIARCDLMPYEGAEEVGAAYITQVGLNLGERIQECAPVIARFTLKFHHPEQEDWEPYDDQLLFRIAHMYQEILSEKFQVTDDDLTCVIMESEHWECQDDDSGRDYILVRIQFQFPFARIAVRNQDTIIRQEALVALHTKVLSHFPSQPIEKWEVALDKLAALTSIPLYGSNDAPGIPKLRISFIVGEITYDDEIDQFIPNEFTVDDTFDPTRHGDVERGLLNLEAFEERSDTNYWLPLFLSLNYSRTVILPKESKPIRRAVKDGASFVVKPNMSPLEKMNYFLSITKPSRREHPTFWMEVGKIFYSLTEGSEEGLALWLKFTASLSPELLTRLKATGDVGPIGIRKEVTLEDICANWYSTFSSSLLTIKTMAWYAREDSPERYEAWHKTWYSPALEAALSCSHKDLSEALYRLYWLEFAYSPADRGKGRWFHYQSHRWFEDKEALDFKSIVKGEFINRFEKVRTALCEKAQRSNDEKIKTECEKNIKRLNKLIYELGQEPFRNSIIRDAAPNFRVIDFTQKLDSDPALTGVIGGVLEVVGNVVSHRPGKPEDYISMGLNLRYPVTFTMTSPLVQEVMTWFHKTYVDEEVCHHFLKFCASLLYGRNSDKQFDIFYGESGDNSKSMIVKLLETTLGAYCIKFDIANLTGKNKNASGPSPQTARAKNCRIVIIDEPDDDDVLLKGVLKRLTGGDSFFARMLQDNGGDIKVTFKLMLVCNKIPVILNPDRATINRVAVFPHTSEFVSNPPADEAEQYRTRKFLKDLNFERRIPVLAPAFLWLMTMYYPTYCQEGVRDLPEIMKMFTQDYWDENDFYMDFIKTHIVKVEDQDGKPDQRVKLSFDELFKVFKSWYVAAYQNATVPNRQTVKRQFTNKWGNMQGNCWYGLTFKQEDSGAAAGFTGLMSKEDILARRTVN